MAANHNNKISKDCGARALSRACKMLGKEISYNQIIELAKPQKKGVSLLTLKHAAENLGLQVQLIRTNYLNLCLLPKPIIVHLRYNHYDVITKCNSRNVEIMDRKIWKKTPLWLFNLEWSGAAMVLSLK